MKKKMIAVLAAGVIVGLSMILSSVNSPTMTALADGGGSYSSTDYEKSNTYLISGSTNLTFSAMTTRLPRLASALITWKVPVTSTFSLSYVRNSYTNAIVTHTITGGKSILVMFNSDVYLKQGDTLLIGNTVADPAQLTLNWR